MAGRDGLHQTVKTTAGQTYDLSFDARSRPDFAGLNPAIEVLWNDKVVATVPSGSDWKAHHFSVTGTGGQDRLTFREPSRGAADGHGALYDNVSLVAAGSASTSVIQPAVPQTAVQPAVQQNAISAMSQKAMDLVTQYSATSSANSGPGFGSMLRQTDLTPALAQTLTRSH